MLQSFACRWLGFRDIDGYRGISWVFGTRSIGSASGTVGVVCLELPLQLVEVVKNPSTIIVISYIVVIIFPLRNPAI